MKTKKMKIVLFGELVLRQQAKPVSVFHKKLHFLIDSMVDTLYSHDDGAALAANQVGILKRIVVVDYEDEYIELVNPEIVNESGEQTDYEGCLSCPGYIGLVKRAEYIKVKFQDRDGNENVIEKDGKIAQCLQHEIDHLNGTLFIDRMVEDFLTHSESKTKISLQSVLDLANGKVYNNSSLFK